MDKDQVAFEPTSPMNVPNDTFEETKRAIIAGLKALNYLHGMCPHFERNFMWAGQALELQHLSVLAVIKRIPE
jgi:hypothetical protein